MLTLYGITNCSTVQKARAWLDSHNLAYEFHDYKKLEIDALHLQTWCEKFGWEQVLNRQGMMWRKATEEDKQKVIDTQSAIEFMIRVPTSIKRPILEKDGQVMLRGFDSEEYEKLLG